MIFLVILGKILKYSNCFKKFIMNKNNKLNITETKK